MYKKEYPAIREAFFAKAKSGKVIAIYKEDNASATTFITDYKALYRSYYEAKLDKASENTLKTK